MNPFAEIHWAEGILLQPQHFQLWQRQLHGTIQRSVSGLQAYAWGVRELQIDEAALENFTVSIPRCEVRLPDGTDVSVPENADLPDLEIKEALDQQPGEPLVIRLGVPRVRDRAANVSADREGVGLLRRYRLDTIEVSDENTGENPRSLDVRRLNARLYLPSDGALEFSSAVPLVRIVRAGEDEPLPVLDRDFVPPTLELDGSTRLRDRTREILHRATARADALAEIIATQDIGFAVEAGGSPEMMLKMHVLNGFLAFYQQFLRVPRLHPLAVYCELCRFTGELAIFTEQRRTPALPPYDHSQLDSCFGGLFEIIDELLRQMYIERVAPTHFKSWKKRYLVASLNPDWFDVRNKFYIAVDSNLDRDEVIRAVVGEDEEKRPQVSMGSSQTIEELARLVRPGVERHAVDRTPIALPERARRVYFELDRKRRDRTSTAGSPSSPDDPDDYLPAGTEELAIYNGSKKELKFILYVVTGEDKGQFQI